MIDTQTRIILLLHRDELTKPRNTGQVALAQLSNGSTTIVDDALEFPCPHIDPTERAYVLCPMSGAVPITELVGLASVVLIVPDGNWPQVYAMQERLALPCVMLPGHAPVLSGDRGLATAEAIAIALGALEGDDVHARVLAVSWSAIERRGPRVLSSGA